MEFEGNEKEIDLIEMLFYNLYQWRKIIIISLIFILLCGGYRYISLSQNLKDSSIVNAKEILYQQELSRYEDNKNRLEKDIDNLKKSIEKQIDYNENSMLMLINPFDEKVANASYYIDTNYLINPELTYQNIDFSGRVIRSYISLAQDGSMYKYIIDNISQDIELKYLKEILTITADYQTNMIFIQVIHSDEKICEDIITLSTKYLNDSFDSINKNIGEHTLKLINLASETAIDYSLDTTQKANLELVTNYNASLVEKENELRALTAPALMVISNSQIIKSSIKYAILGFIIGIILSIAFITLKYILNGKIKSVKSFRTLYHLRILGVYEDETRKRFGQFIDLIINKLRSKNKISKDNSIKRISANIEAILEIEKIINGRVILTGTINKSDLDEMFNRISKELKSSNIKLCAAGNISYSADTINMIRDCDGIIFVEKIEQTGHNEFIKQLDYIKDLEKNIIGTILIK